MNSLTSQRMIKSCTELLFNSCQVEGLTLLLFPDFKQRFPPQAKKEKKKKINIALDGSKLPRMQHFLNGSVIIDKYVNM